MLLLASKSPRRRELLHLLGMEYKIVDIKDVEEVYPSDLPSDEVPLFLSRLKAEAYKLSLKTGDILITADTVVIIDSEIIGKPHSLEEAKTMLRKLSGRTHKVITGVTLTSSEKMQTFAAHTDVTFTQLSDEEIDYYVDTYKPLDKAGAYGVQEWIGAIGVSKIEGSFYNVMGLPLQKLYKELLLFK